MDVSSLGVQAKCKKLCVGHRVTRFDGLCDLPDAVLHKILSCLPVKDVVKTSILSKRWQYLWASVPDLKISEWAFPKRSVFMNFVERAFIFRESSSIRAFSLTCDVLQDASRINTWITASARGNLVELKLNLHLYGRSFTLPCCIFGCTTLSKLELNLPAILTPPSTAWFPNLNHLSLQSVTFVDASSVEKLFSSPLLEELSIKGCGWKNLKTITVTAANLVKLSIDDSYMEYSEDHVSSDREVRILADSLRYFYYNGSLINIYCICGTTMHLVEAEISVTSRGEGVDAIKLHELLNPLSSVESLTLTGSFLMDLLERVELRDALPHFTKLIKLKFDGNWFCFGCDALFALLTRSPNLKSLELVKDCCSEFSLPDKLLLPPLKELKSIKFRDFYGNGTDHLLVRTLLGASTALEEMVLHYDGTMAEKESLSKLLMLCPRGLNCRILILSPTQNF